MVLDDDPTGSQAVHDLDLVLELDPREVAAALEPEGATAFLLTNTRSLPEADAVRVTGDAARVAFARAADRGEAVEVLCRGDSTLRGHVVAELAAVDAARRDVLGAGYDGFLLCPAYLEAGRVTVDDVHYARVDGRLRPVAETDYARDATFGYADSDLRAFVAERTGGAVRAADVASIGLDLIREGGPGAVAARLGELSDGAWAVVNAERQADLDVVAEGLREAEAAGARLLARGGPSLAQALAGGPRRGPLRPDELVAPPGRAAHGLVVVGSHVGLSARQLRVLHERHDLAALELDVALVAAGDGAAAEHLAGLALEAAAALETHDVVLSTSRALVRGSDEQDSLRIARAVSAALVGVVRALRATRPAWVLAKGGITSHDIARHGLGIRRARVLGQLWPGMVSVVRPVSAPPEVVGMPYVIFAGNVGGDETLADAVAMLRGAR